MINAIVAVCDDWGIGWQGGLLVPNKADMASFVAHTKGGTVVMGRSTLESFPGGRPLRGRRNIVITRNPGYAVEGAEVVHSVEEALAAVAEDAADPSRVWVIGGASIYEQMLPHTDRVVVTHNHCVRPADTFFPNLEADPAWHVESTEPGGTTPEGVEFEFRTYVRA